MKEKQARSFAVNKVVCFALLVVILIAGNVSYQYRYLRPSDDYFWLMFTSNNLMESDKGSRLYERYDAFLKDSGYETDALARAGVRQVMDENYLLQGAFFVPFVHVARHLPLSIEEKTVFVMFGGFLSMYMAVSLLLLLVMWRCRDPNLVMSLMLATALIYFIDFTARPKVYHHFHPGVAGVDLFEQVKHFFARLFHPGPKYVIFNFAPKDRLMVLVTVFLLLRWGGRVRLTYLLLPLLFVVHVEYAGLIVALFVGIDLLVRPRLVMRSWIVPWVGLLLGVFVVISALGRQLDVAPWLAVGPILLGLAGMAAFRALERSAPARLRSIFDRYGAFVGRRSPPAQDIFAFAAVWLAMLPLTYVIYLLSGEKLEENGTHLNSYLWLLVPTRYLGFFALATLTFLIWSLLRVFAVQVRWGAARAPGTEGQGFWTACRGPAAVMLLVVLLLAPCVNFVAREGAAPWTVAVQKIGALEAAFDQPLTLATWRTDEVRVYYAMFTMLLTEEDRLARLGVP